MIRTSSLIVFACASKACAPPPVGSGGSKPGASVGSIDDQLAHSTSLRTGASESPEGVAVTKYIDVGHGVINGALRWPNEDGSFNVETRRNIELMDKAFDKFGVPLSSDVVVYRGMTMTPYSGQMGRLETLFAPGSIVDDKGFVSTSTKRSIADGFTAPQAVASVILKIKVPEGTRVLAGYEKEKEVLLNRGSRFRVVKTERTTPSLLEVEMELVP